MKNATVLCGMCREYAQTEVFTLGQIDKARAQAFQADDESRDVRLTGLRRVLKLDPPERIGILTNLNSEFRRDFFFGRSVVDHHTGSTVICGEIGELQLFALRRPAAKKDESAGAADINGGCYFGKDPAGGVRSLYKNRNSKVDPFTSSGLHDREVCN